MKAVTDDDGCCQRLVAALADEDVPVGYSPADREWWLRVVNIDPDNPEHDWRRQGSLQLLTFCPFCGNRFPRDLGDDWFRTLAGMGFEAPFEGDIPEEFKSDRWWKERGL